jgi:hypothetical protein
MASRCLGRCTGTSSRGKLRSKTAAGPKTLSWPRNLATARHWPRRRQRGVASAETGSWRGWALATSLTASAARGGRCPRGAAGGP